MRRTTDNSWFGFQEGQEFYILSGGFRPTIALPHPALGTLGSLLLGRAAGEWYWPFTSVWSGAEFDS